MSVTRCLINHLTHFDGRNLLHQCLVIGDHTTLAINDSLHRVPSTWQQIVQGMSCARNKANGPSMEADESIQCHATYLETFHIVFRLLLLLLLLLFKIIFTIVIIAQVVINDKTINE
jgi:hypothetical protein